MSSTAVFLVLISRDISVWQCVWLLDTSHRDPRWFRRQHAWSACQMETKILLSLRWLPLRHDSFLFSHQDGGWGRASKAGPCLVISCLRTNKRALSLLFHTVVMLSLSGAGGSIDKLTNECWRTLPLRDKNRAVGKLHCYPKHFWFILLLSVSVFPQSKEGGFDWFICVAIDYYDIRSFPVALRDWSVSEEVHLKTRKPQFIWKLY